MSDAWGRDGEPPFHKGDHYHHPDLRDAMIRVAQALVESDGPGGWTVRAAARIAGVSSGAPYRHFADKDSLLAAVAVRGFDELCAALEAELGASDDGAELARLAQTYLRCARGMPRRYQILYGRDLLDPRAHPELNAAVDRLFALFVRIAEAAQASGALHTDLPTNDLAHALWATWHGLADLMVAGRIAGDVATDPERLTRLALGGLALQR